MGIVPFTHFSSKHLGLFTCNTFTTVWIVIWYDVFWKWWLSTFYFGLLLSLNVSILYICLCQIGDFLMLVRIQSVFFFFLPVKYYYRVLLDKIIYKYDLFQDTVSRHSCTFYYSKLLICVVVCQPVSSGSRFKPW